MRIRFSLTSFDRVGLDIDDVDVEQWHTKLFGCCMGYRMAVNDVLFNQIGDERLLVLRRFGEGFLGLLIIDQPVMNQTSCQTTELDFGAGCRHGIGSVLP